MERSRNGSCFFDEVLHTRHVTSDWSIPPKIDVTSECDDEEFDDDDVDDRRREYGDDNVFCRKDRSDGSSAISSVCSLSSMYLRNSCASCCW